MARAPVAEAETDANVLDLRGALSLPLGREDESLDRVRTIAPLRGLADGWAELLVEVHRVLREDGVLVATLRAGWWAEVHWERAFELVELDTGSAPATRAVLRKRPGTPSAADLESPDPDEPPELAAMRASLVQLARALDEMRESFHAEAGRKSARIAHLEQLVHEIDGNYRATLSWRATSPLRAAGKLARSARRRS